MSVRFVLILAVAASMACAWPAGSEVIQNHSFELETDGFMPNGCDTAISPFWGLPDAWYWRLEGPLNGHGAMLPQGHATDGAWSLEMFATAGGGQVPGDFIEWHQSVDPTQTAEILFDVTLEYHSLAVSYVAVDDEVLWSGDEAGTYLDQSVNVNHLVGDHQLALGVRMVGYGSPGGADGLTFWDNLRSVAVVAAEPVSLSRIKSLFRR